MLDQLQAQWDRFLEYWNGLESRQQYTFIGIIAITALVISLVMYWALQPQWVTLYNQQLDINEVADLRSELENLGIESRVDGNVIQVPLSQVDEARMQLAQAGVTPRSTVGFEIFEEGGIGITNFERQVRYKRALEGSLARAIQSNPQITRAEVQIAMQQEQPVFESDEEPVRASVKVHLKPYAKLDQEQVQGIVNLVSYGVVGLDAKNVRITDQHDRPLKEYDKEGTSSKQIQQLRVVDRIERKLDRRLNQSLGRILTPERLSTAVNVKINFDHIEKHITEYRQPEGSFEQLRKKEDIEEENFTGAGTLPGGEAGVESNIPGSEQIDTQAAEYERQRRVVEYFADQNVTRIVKDPALQRLTANVAVNGQYEIMRTEDGELETSYTPPTEEQMEKIENLAEAAIGYNEDRGDRIEVAHIKFDRSAELEERREQIRREAFQRRLAYFILAAIALTLIVIGILFWFRKRAREREEAEAEEPELPGQEDLMTEVSVEEERQKEIRDEIQERAEENPEMVASVMRSWFTEEMS